MSLRRSPRRTLAFLAANRANAQKSTGPRTAPGKERSAANALRTGKRASPAFWPRVLSHSQLAEFHALRHAIERAVSASGENQNVAGRNTRLIWSVRRYAERYLRTLPPDARWQIAKRLIPVPRCWRSAIPGPGWKVTVTVFARRGRRRRCDLSPIPTIDPPIGPTMGPAAGAIRTPEARPANWERGHPCPHRVYVITRVTCTGHPQFNRGPEGVPLSSKPGAKLPEKRTNPECLRNQETYENIAPNADCHGAGSAGVPPAFDGLRQRQRGEAVLAEDEEKRARRPRSIEEITLALCRALSVNVKNRFGGGVWPQSSKAHHRFTSGPKMFLRPRPFPNPCRATSR